MTHSRTWKRAESLAAQIIGGRRVWQKFSAGDAESEAFVADAKKRLAYSQRQMRDDLDKLQASPETGSRTAVLVLVDTPGRGRRARAPLVVLTAEQFMAWHRPDADHETTDALRWGDQPMSFYLRRIADEPEEVPHRTFLLAVADALDTIPSVEGRAIPRPSIPVDLGGL